MNDFRVTEDRHIFLDGVEIKRVHGFEVHIKAMENPEVVLRVSVGSVTIEGYTDLYQAARDSA